MSRKKVHFIGIAGKGMSATALLLKQSGWLISGSDENFYPPVSTYLNDANIAFAEGYKKENIPSDVDQIVIGKNAKLVPESNEEVAAAFASGKPVRSFAAILAELTQGKETIIVAGSYGKSTCTALLAWCLKEAGGDPSYFIGEVTIGFDTAAHLGTSNIFVLEGDEYPAANWDSKSKFLYYNANNVLLTSATHDHINVFSTHESYLAPFKELLASLPRGALLVANADEQYASALADSYAGTKVSYGLEAGAKWTAQDIGDDMTFDLMRGGEKVVRLKTSLLGKHNIQNIVGIGSLLLEKGLLTPEDLARTVGTFQGVKRRMELLSPRSTVPVFEGFGSSYEKARSAIAAIKHHFPTRRPLVVFEPHTFTWRNRGAIDAYDTVFEGTAQVYIYEPSSQGAATHPQLSQSDIVARVRSVGVNASAISSKDDALKTLEDELDNNDVVLLLTSGDLGGLIEAIPELAEQKFPK